MKYIVNSLEETKKLAHNFAKNIQVGKVVLLNGDLGAGKTTFTQFVFAHLGVTEPVTSPTFSILKSYQTSKYVLHHFDMYRINEEEAIESGFDEILSDNSSIKFVEWSGNVEALLPKNCIIVNIKLIDENKREFEIIYE